MLYVKKKKKNRSFIDIVGSHILKMGRTIKSLGTSVLECFIKFRQLK